MQSHIRMFKPEILFEKQPLVIDDNTYDIDVLKSQCFSINPSQSFTITDNNTWITNKYKYLVLQAHAGPIDILLCNPNSRDPQALDSDIVEVQLSEGQILILPYKWMYLLPDSSVRCIGIHDFVTYFLP